MSSLIKQVFFCFLISNSCCIAGEENSNYEISGVVSNIQYIETQRKDNYEQSIDLMGSMYGALGALVASILSIEERAYNIYTINTVDGRVFEVASRSTFNKNDCVKSIFPKSSGDYPEIGIDADVKLESSNECIESPSNSE